jgi:hypothetical protein
VSNHPLWMGGPWIYDPTDEAHGYFTIWTQADIDACTSQPGFDHYGTWIYYWEESFGPASSTLWSGTNQEHNWDFISLHPVIVGPILYCFYVLWHRSRNHGVAYFYHSSEYVPAIIDYCSNNKNGPPPVTGSQVWESEVSDPAPEDYYEFSVLMKACVYTEDALEEAKAAVDGADAGSIRQMLSETQKYLAAPYWGYPAFDWLPEAPGEMQEQLTDLWLNHKHGDDTLFVADHLEEQEIKTRPHTKAELQEADMWPKEE